MVRLQTVVQPISLLSFKFLLLTLAATIFCCQGIREIENTDPAVTMSGGLIFFNGEPFTGKLIQKNSAMDEIYITTYENGIEEGEFRSEKISGQLLEKRYFKNGEKHGIHRSWYPNGNYRLYAEFDKGRYTKESWSWYDNGNPSKYEKYDKDGKVVATKVWNRAGHIYMNLAFNKDGSSVGLPGSKICKPIEPVETKNLK